jgi:hypothetical protein
MLFGSYLSLAPDATETNVTILLFAPPSPFLYTDTDPKGHGGTMWDRVLPLPVLSICVARPSSHPILWLLSQMVGLPPITAPGTLVMRVPEDIL